MEVYFLLGSSLLWVRWLAQASQWGPGLLPLCGYAISWLQATLTSFRTQDRIVWDAFMNQT